MFLAASAARMARLRTSSATTANPAPASPARAASTAAFRASRLVWKAISSMVLMILAVSSLARRDLVHGLGQLGPWTRWPSATTCLASLMRLLAWSALSAFCLVMEDISSREEEVSSMEAACWLAPSASDWAAPETWPAAEPLLGPLAQPVDDPPDRAGDRAGDEEGQRDPDHQGRDQTDDHDGGGGGKARGRLLGPLLSVGHAELSVALASCKTSSATTPRFLVISSRSSHLDRNSAMVPS